jgi:hypothetical protein
MDQGQAAMAEIDLAAQLVTALNQSRPNPVRRAAAS